MWYMLKLINSTIFDLIFHIFKICNHINDKICFNSQSRFYRLEKLHICNMQTLLNNIKRRVLCSFVVIPLRYLKRRQTICSYILYIYNVLQMYILNKPPLVFIMDLHRA